MSLGTKFVLILLSLVTSMVTLFTYLNIEEDEKTFNIQLENRVIFIKNQMIKNARYTMLNYKSEIENDLASMNLSNISHILKQLSKREEIEGVSLVSEDNKMQLFEGVPRHSSVKKETISINEHAIIMASPIIISKHWGTFTLVYSLSGLNQEIAKAKAIGTVKKRHNIQDAIALAISIFVLFGILIYFWGRRFMQPILLLTKSAQRVTDGTMAEDEELSLLDRNDEVGTLAKTFQKMIQKLDNSHKALKELNESLEDKIKERTLDLEKSKDELKFLASIDPMTGLYNRRYFSEFSKKIFSTNKQEHKTLSLIMLDIDDFKKVNDTYGHHVGDQVIIAVADILSEHTRKDDVVCRYGGEEYIILFSEISNERCLEISYNIRLSVEGMSIKLEGNRELNVTISIGVAASDIRVDNDIEIGINRADKALYEAKRTGKNKVILYSSNH